MDMNKLEKIELDVLESGVWGTVGPYSVSAAKALADYTGGKFAVLCHSYDAAYEAVLRHFGARLANLPHGDVTVVGEISCPSDSLVALCVGSDAEFCPVCDTCGMISPKAVETAIEGAKLPVRAVVVDYLAEKADKYPLERVYEICKAREIPLIINAGGAIGVRHGYKALTELCDATLYTLGEGSAIDVGMSGLIVTDSEAVQQGSFAYHNCGRGFGEGCSLVMDNIIGGDLRVTEWTAAAAQTILESGELAAPAPMTLVKMKGQPVFDK